MRTRFTFAALALILLGLPVPAVHAQGNDGFPFSIVNEPGQRRATQRVRPAPPPKAQPAAAPKQAATTTPRRVRRGSSTYSTIPTYRSPLTPLGTVQPMPTAPSMAYPSSPPTVVPGVAGTGGLPAIAPGRPAGQTFQDRAQSCIMSGTGQGVGPGQIGSFTQSCVNR
ncbi:hypothetical protein [Pseudorhodoplanes sp.]|uniref:hypothetical protein n=1 Tax=Pseudorhodoplanes sp. TaxID=1934341 RepID=UPI002CA7352D|nr:hypothetical protein [Pseudorhodoplanes sp.]HWV53380.1 hypothetical protein [Pseudorhodoplanes sp.]